MIVIGAWGLVGGVHQLISPPRAFVFSPPWGGIIDLLFGISLTVSASIWLKKGSGWGRYVAIAWLTVLIPVSSFVLGILLY